MIVLLEGPTPRPILSFKYSMESIYIYIYRYISRYVSSISCAHVFGGSAPISESLGGRCVNRAEGFSCHVCAGSVPAAVVSCSVSLLLKVRGHCDSVGASGWRLISNS